MPAMAAPLLEADCAGRKIQIVVHHQQASRGDLVEARKRCHASPTVVHKGHGLEQPADVFQSDQTGHLPKGSRMLPKAEISTGSQPIQEPVTGIVPRFSVLWAWIAEPYHQFDRV